MIKLISNRCLKCGNYFEILNEAGLCKNCVNGSLVSMRCPECRHTWKSPGTAAWCPSCGNTNVTSDDEVVDKWMWEDEAQKHGVKFLGIQDGCGIIPSIPLFEDPATGSFVLQSGEGIADALQRKRFEFAKHEVV